MTKLTYSILTQSFVCSFALIPPATAQSVTGSASVSGKITTNATGIFIRAARTKTSANPLTPQSPNTGSFVGPKGWEL